MVFYKRMIDPGFWGSTTYVNAESESEVVFWQAMISSADDQGRIKDVPQVLWATIFAPRISNTITVEDVERWLEKFAAMGNILRYAVGDGNFIQMVKWGTYQLLTRPRPSNFPPPPGWTDTAVKGEHKADAQNTALGELVGKALGPPKPTAPKPKLQPIIPVAQDRRERVPDGGTSIADVLNKKFNPAALAVHREPPPGATAHPKPEVDDKGGLVPPRTPEEVAGFDLIAAELKKRRVIKATPYAATRYCGANPNYSAKFRELGWRAFLEPYTGDSRQAYQGITIAEAAAMDAANMLGCDPE